MKIDIQICNIDLINRFIGICPRNKLYLSEYTFLKELHLKEKFITDLSNLIEKAGSLNLVALENKIPIGMLNVVKDEFDSVMLQVPCYKIINIIVLSNDIKRISEIINALIEKLEIYINNSYNKFHITIPINNNVDNATEIFNILLNKGFYYIHTLLTFSHIKKSSHYNRKITNRKINIRTAKQTDVDDISNLAKKSFQYSRYHLDPNIDNSKGDILLKTSARNSILDGFVDIMFIAEYDNRIVGYYSAKKTFFKEFNINFGEAVISAVDERYRGMGIFSSLHQNLINWFDDNTEVAEMGTYLINSPVHKTWIKSGLNLIRGTHQLSKLYQ